jgi:hypothetical protein
MVIVSQVVWDSPSREAVGYGTPPSCACGAHPRCSTSQIETSTCAEIIGEEGGADDHPSMPLADVQLTAELIAGIGRMNLNP